MYTLYWKSAFRSIAPVLFLLPIAQIAVSGLFSETCRASETTGPVRYVEVTPRSHSFLETFSYVGSLYATTALGYYLINMQEVNQNATLQNYTNNIGKAVLFDQDLPSANWFVHGYLGGILYQFYRSRSYSKTDSFLLCTLQSSLFEFTTETLEEPASLEDTVNTPVLGSIIGRAFELASLPLMNSDNLFLKVLGHLLNPPTMFGLYEGTVMVQVVPLISRKTDGITLRVRF